MFDSSVSEGVLRVRRRGARWLSTGWAGGFVEADAAYNMTVPEGWERTDVTAVVEERRDRAGFVEPGPALLTGVDLQHARGARAGPVKVFATVGLSNPAALPMDPQGGNERVGDWGTPDASDPAGTINLIIAVQRELADSGLGTLVGLASEAKAATLLPLAGFPGTTTDAVIVGCDPDEESVQFTGSATEVGAATRACVRDAIQASFRSRYSERPVPKTVADAEYGVVTDERAAVFRL